MDEVDRTLAAYEADADAFVEKYCDESVAELFGDPFVEALPGDRVLDVGCGPGPDLTAFHEADLEPVGLDPTRSFLHAAAERLPTVSLVRGDMRQLPLSDSSVDGLWSSASFLHVPRDDAEPAMREFRRVLRSDGVAFVSVKRFDPDEYDPGGRHFEYYRLVEFRELIDAGGFEPIDVRTQGKWLAALAAPRC